MVKLPNVLITGVPGTGKSTLAMAVMMEVNKKLQAKYGESCKKMRHMQISKIINDNHLYTERDVEMDATIFDEKLLKQFLLHSNVQEGGYILDFHDALSCVEYVNRVYVLITRTEVLYDRLVERNYKKRKIEANMESLIFNEIQTDLKDYPSLYRKENELCNNDEREFKINIQTISNWIVHNVKP